MGVEVSLRELIDEIRERGEIRKVYVGDPPLTKWINDSIADLFDHILSVNADFRYNREEFDVIGDQDVYDLPIDFGHVRRVEVLYHGANNWQMIEQYGLQQRSQNNWVPPHRLYWEYRIMGNKFYLVPVPTQTGTLRIHYIPLPKTLSEDADKEDLGYRWDEYVILDCLIKHASKEESDTIVFERKQAMVLGRIMDRARIHHYGEPPAIRDLEDESLQGLYPQAGADE